MNDFRVNTKSSKSIKRSAAKKIQKAFIKYTYKTHKQRRLRSLTKKKKAAKIIQTALIKNTYIKHRLNRLKTILFQNKGKSCINKPITFRDDNLVMDYKNYEDYITNIFTVFTNIRMDEIIKKLHEFINTNQNTLYFIIKKEDDETISIIHAIAKKNKIKLEQSPSNTIPYDDLPDLFIPRDIFKQICIPYLLNILANCYIINDMKMKKEYIIAVNTELHTSKIIDIHQDLTLYTCLTYVNSPITTELVFSPEILPKTSCNPIFRFKTNENAITSLCFKDELVLHTVPIFTSGNIFMEDDEDAGIIENAEFININRHKHHKPKSRKSIHPVLNRHIIILQIGGNHYPDSYYECDYGEYENMMFNIENDINIYKIASPREHIQLSNDNIESIIENVIMKESKLGSVYLTGGN